MIAKFILPVLLYSMSALQPVISTETMELHYGKHFRGYVENLNKIVPGTEYEEMSLVEIVQKAPEGALLNNAGQALNHTLYFEQFTPKQRISAPEKELGDAIKRDFGSFDEFKAVFSKAANSLFGSGWAWLSTDKEGYLHITQDANGLNPVRNGLTPLLGIDVWEHAYYLDYRNKRADHVAGLWTIIDWDIVGKRYRDACKLSQ
ncbi:superoxide dismutase [Porphyromonas macacae]|uniref:Superoxide dismutase n=1 Tax=Porphyromonas macacae TaxID=28115 RepID=A0A379DG37_9PORP|nr:superoxide dismutase [Porphyromonas macacae]SUB77368.1 Superoxide dismutase [Mn/Fe] [Porphyromonas macacae]